MLQLCGQLATDLKFGSSALMYVVDGQQNQIFHQAN
jgi:hypothetical protein